MFKLYEDKKRDFDQIIINYFPNGEFENILNYSIEKGKRVRPLILLETYKMLGGQDISLAEKFALALEFIHNYSLVHDDLPDLDNDNYRRGRETTHYKFGSDMAILAGDALMNYAYELVFESLKDYPNNLNLINAGHVLAENAGYRGMIGGQIRDISNDLDSTEKMVDMYLNKTCKLFMTATKVAAYLSNQEDEVIEEMDRLGFYIGMAFQLQDDLLDIEQDEKIGKLTYISLEGKEKAISEMERYTEDALEIISKYDNNEFLMSLITYLQDRNI